MTLEITAPPILNDRHEFNKSSYDQHREETLSRLGVEGGFTDRYNDDILGAVAKVAQPLIDYAREQGYPDPSSRYEVQNLEESVFLGRIRRDDGTLLDFTSTRVRVGKLEDGQTHRGGVELTPMALPEKIAEKAALMQMKHEIMATGECGGKGGIALPEGFDASTLSEHEREKLMQAFAVIHNINPYNNTGATDLYTRISDMNAMVTAASWFYGPDARMAVSGASEEFGGVPDFQGLATGLGNAHVVSTYLQVERSRNPRLARMLQRPIGFLVEGGGKAGGGLIRSMDVFSRIGTIGLGGLMERSGGVTATRGAFIDPNKAMAAVRKDGLRYGSHLYLGNAVQPNNLAVFYGEQRGSILTPAFDRLRLDPTHIDPENTVLINEVANRGVKLAAAQYAARLGIDVLTGGLANGPGTTGSTLRWRLLMQGIDNELILREVWKQQIRERTRSVLDRRFGMAQERGVFVSIEHAAIDLSLREAA